MRKMEAKQQKAKKKAQALDGIALLAEAAKDLWVFSVRLLLVMLLFRNTLVRQLLVMLLRNTLFCNYYFDIIPLMSRLETVRV